MFNCDVLRNYEFWLVIVFSFVVSFAMTVIIQDVWNIWNDLHTTNDNEEFSIVILNDDLPLAYDCRVFDIVHNHIGIFLAFNGEYAIVAVLQGNNKIHIYHTNPEALIVVEDME